MLSNAHVRPLCCGMAFLAIVWFEVLLGADLLKIVSGVDFLSKSTSFFDRI